MNLKEKALNVSEAIINCLSGCTKIIHKDTVELFLTEPLHTNVNDLFLWIEFERKSLQEEFLDNYDKAKKHKLFMKNEILRVGTKLSGSYFQDSRFFIHYHSDTQTANFTNTPITYFYHEIEADLANCEFSCHDKKTIVGPKPTWIIARLFATSKYYLWLLNMKSGQLSINSSQLYPIDEVDPFKRIWINYNENFPEFIKILKNIKFIDSEENWVLVERKGIEQPSYSPLAVIDTFINYGWIKNIDEKVIVTELSKRFRFPDKRYYRRNKPYDSAVAKLKVAIHNLILVDR
ncbi:MAG: hypothetical protein K9I85_08975 [Saprospiraceae bacterium]|nr:hypothetical protein [Saprospiraceae bacterium]